MCVRQETEYFRMMGIWENIQVSEVDGTQILARGLYLGSRALIKKRGLSGSLIGLNLLQNMVHITPNELI